MLFFKKNTTLAKADLLKGMTDYHCHILPDVDDGIKHIEHTLQVLAYYEQIGIQKVWCTPHVMEDVPNTAAHLTERFEELKNAYHGTIKLNLASEYMLDNGFMDYLNNRELLPIGDDKDMILVETRTFSAPRNMESIFNQIKSAGYFPLLAHPERYIYMNEDDYQYWKRNDIKFQLNIPSLAGVYGKEEKRKAEWLILNDMYDYYGSDLHNAHHIAESKFPFSEYPIKKKVVPHFRKLIEQAQ